MKTIKILILFTGIFCINFAYSFTTETLPESNVKENVVDKLFVYGESALLSEIENIIQENTTSANLEDTIIVDLNEIVVTEGLNGKSKICIQKQVPYPDFAMEQKLEGVVAVCLVFDHDGNAIIKESFSSNNELENYVIDKLHHLQFSNCVLQIGKEYNLRFTFQLL